MGYYISVNHSRSSQHADGRLSRHGARNIGLRLCLYIPHSDVRIPTVRLETDCRNIFLRFSIFFSKKVLTKENGCGIMLKLSPNRREKIKEIQKKS